ncbi:peptidylprolyl isomerase [Leptothrix sp. BB-4]
MTRRWHGPLGTPLGLLPGLLLCAALLAWPGRAPAQDAPAGLPSAAALAADAQPFARIGDLVVTRGDYRRALGVAMRQKYYHAKPPEAEVAAFQREIGQALVDRQLLLAEARRQGLQADAARVEAQLRPQAQRLSQSAGLDADHRDRMLAAWRAQFEGDALIERLQAGVKAVAAPDDATLRAWHAEHRDRFVEPEQVRLSVILLKVEASSKQAVWDAAHAEAAELHTRLKAGADFAETARLQSADASAADGGRLDYIHRGMLPEALHGVVDALQPGQLSAPVQVLEGVALIRLDDRRAARERPLAEVRERAVDLWLRDQGEARWRALIERLRAATPVQIDESVYAPLPAQDPRARAG